MTPMTEIINEQASYWMWTGDIAPHDIWNITREEVIFQIRLVTDLVKNHAKVPVYPVIGNHEGVPVNSFPPPEVKGDLSISWLYEELANQWSYWLPEDALETLRFGGYYRVNVRPGFRIICLNTNYCTRLNPWSLYDPVDPGNQLKWMIRELFDAEVDGDHVHIIGHIPPDNKECTQAWLFNYLRIIERFQDTILAQYFGHTHRDEFRVLLSPSPKPRPMSVAYIAPSITAFTENNPGYRVYYTDDQGYVRNHETYFYNLTEANNIVEPIWRKEYAAYDNFNMTNLGPFGWHGFVSKMLEDDSVFQNYYK
jgi:sphingomyelin phosphodiesterase